MDYAMQICDSCRLNTEVRSRKGSRGLIFDPRNGKIFRRCSFCGQTAMSWRFRSTVKWIQACYREPK